MEKRFKRSLKGYDPGLVKSKVKELQDIFANSYKELDDLLLSLQNKNISLQEQVDVLTNEIDKWKCREEKVAQALFEVHIQSVIKVYEANKQAEQMENEKLALLSHLEKENANLCTSISCLTRELYNKVEEYRIKMEAFQIGKRRENSAG